MTLIEDIKAARNTKKEFKQTFDIIVNLRNIDLRKPEHKIKADITLPNGLGKQSKICIIADSLASHAKGIENVIVIKKDEIPGMSKKDIRKVASQVRSFMAEMTTMPLVGKHFGQILAPRNLMPKPIPASMTNLEPMVKRACNEVRFAIKNSPVVQVPLGTEDMSDEHIAGNAEAILNTISTLLPNGKDQIKSVMIKTTMGKPVKVMKW